MKTHTKTYKLNAMHNIHRIDITYRNTHGWQVRTTIGGIDRSKWFSDAKYFGSSSALYEATSYRNVMLDVLSKQ